MRTIMIVDDEQNVLDGLRRTLSWAHETRVLTCSDPNAALALASQENVDLFICDYQMPHMNGVGFLVFVRELHPQASRFLSRGGDDFRGLASAINLAGIHRFISKPVEPDELLFIADQALSQRRSRVREAL